MSFSPSPIKMAHTSWSSLLKKGSTAIDATSGNGKDTAVLADLVGPKGLVIAMDLQEEALLKTKENLSKEQLGRVLFYQQSHESFPAIVDEKPIALVVYNLGYLPGGNKSIVTNTQSTLRSIQQALTFAEALSITCYPGHKEGKQEEEALLEFSKRIDKQGWTITYTRWINREAAPSLFLYKKNKLIHI